MNQTTINYSPLQKLSKLSIESNKIVIPVFLSALLIGILVAFSPAEARSGLQVLAVAVSILGTICAVIWLLMKLSAINKSNDAVYVSFAQANGFQYSPTSKDTQQVGTLFEVGHSKQKSHIFSGFMGELPFTTFTYKYETGSGKSRRSYDAAVFEITLPRVLPQFVIDSQLESVMPITFDKSQKIELEGDFHKYFDLYAPDKYGITALTLLAPDTMEVLMDHAALCDIEVIQNKIYFYWPSPSSTEKQFREIFTTATAVLNKLEDKLTTTNIYQSEAQEQIHAVPSTQGVRLKRSKAGLLLFAAAAVYFVFEILGIFNSAIAALILPLIWVSVIGYLLFSASRQSGLKKQYLDRYKSNSVK